MKRFLAFLLLAVVFSSCDDGDLSQVSFEFDDSLAVQCGTETDDFFIYKTQDRRALIIQLPEINFPNRISADLSTQPAPLIINGSTVRLIYREYSGDVSQSTICSTVPAANPYVVQEREATEGTITITTTAIKTEPDANGTTAITYYLHTLVFKDLVFDLDDGNKQINEAFTQVTYKTTATPFTPFAGLTGLFSCENDDTFLFKYTGNQALVLDLNNDDAAFLFSGEAGPKTRLISAESKLTRFFFNTDITTLNNDYFCANLTPATPPITDAFKAEDGVENVSGIIEVTSLASDNGFKHTIVLKNVRMVKGTLKVQMGTEYIFGEFETTN
ncbi:hypothetical protein [Flavobacterium sp. SM2513]|uniref:hypothetical protein n=1 Tax=Flavobacterium sp. SM2513 TaxID=3424766 RepID=UPI003D7F9F2B